MKRVIVLLLLVAQVGVAEKKDDARARALAQLRAADECRRMPRSLNPYGAACSVEMAKRWSSCTDENLAARFDCFGFRRPTEPTGMAAFQLSMMRKFVVGQCESLPASVNSMGARCKDEVAARFERCGPPSLTKEITNEALMDCLGFDLPPPAPPPKRLASCERPRIRAKMSVSAGGKVIIDERDVDRLRLEDVGGERRALVELSSDAAQRFAEATRAHVGEKIVLDLAGVKTEPVVETAITGGRFYFLAGQLGPADVCRQ
jgi:hypothetical protein